MTAFHALVRLLADGRPCPVEVIRRSLPCSATELDALRLQAIERGLEVRLDAGSGEDAWRLAEPVELLEESAIRAALPTAQRGRLAQLEILPEVGSTNSRLLAGLDSDLAAGHVCLTEYQNAGRGRRGRSWHSPYARDLTLSVLWDFPARMRLEGLSLAVGVGVARALEELGCRGLGLKWPNDVVAGGAKLGGVLIETRLAGDRRWRVVVGTGLNLLAASGGWAHIEQPWTSVEAIRGSPAGRNHAAGVVVGQLLAVLAEYASGGFAPFHAAWTALDVARDQPVRLQEPAGERCGTGRGIARDGALLVEIGGRLERFASAEVSLRIGPCASAAVEPS